jgi:ATP diphosphatase
VSVNYSLEDLLYLMRRLRDPQDGCPWDREQSLSSIVPHTIEESYELADAIGQGDFQQIKEELGDVLFQVVFYAQLAAEQEQFEFTDIVSGLVEKLLRRHPHVFPDGSLQSRVGQQSTDMQTI